jgi:hypothetical protein
MRLRTAARGPAIPGPGPEISTPHEDGDYSPDSESSGQSAEKGGSWNFSFWQYKNLMVPKAKGF